MSDHAEVVACVTVYRELVGEHPCKRFSPADFAAVMQHYGPIFGLRLLTGKPVDITMHALDRARARTERINA